MSRRLFAVILAFVTALWNGAMFQCEDWARARWQDQLHSSGHLAYWWLAMFLFSIGGYIVVLLVLYLLAQRYFVAHITPAAVSLSIDLGMTTMLWSFAELLRDPLLSAFFPSVGLGNLHTICFWIGALWFVVGIARLKIMYPPSQRAHSPAGLAGSPGRDPEE